MQNFPLNILTFPVWWYTVGLNLAIKAARQRFWFGLKKSGLGIFARHLKEPLYGDYTRTGIIFSFFIRLFLILFKILWLAVRFAVIGLCLLAYLLILPIVMALIISQLIWLI